MKVHILLSVFLTLSCTKEAPEPPVASTVTPEVVKAQESQPPAQESQVKNPKVEASQDGDCSGLLSDPDVAVVGNRRVRQLGKFAAGSMVGTSFMPVLYFHTYKDAKKCVRNDMEIMVWSGSKWKVPG